MYTAMTTATIATMSQRINSPTRFPDIFSSLGHGALARADRLEFPYLIRERQFHRQPLHRGGAVEAVAIAGIPDDEIRVVRGRDRTAMREHENFRIDAERRLGPGVDARRTVFQLQCRLGADGTAGGQ